MLFSPTHQPSTHPPNYPSNHAQIRLPIHSFMTCSFKAGPGPSNSSREQLLVYHRRSKVLLSASRNYSPYIQLMTLGNTAGERQG